MVVAGGNQEGTTRTDCGENRLQVSGGREELKVMKDELGLLGDRKE